MCRLERLERRVIEVGRVANKFPFLGVAKFQARWLSALPPRDIRDAPILVCIGSVIFIGDLGSTELGHQTMSRAIYLEQRCLGDKLYACKWKWVSFFLLIFWYPDFFFFLSYTMINGKKKTHLLLIRRPVQQTTVQVCYTSSGFNYRMIAVDSNIQSTYYGCNEPVFYADAMEAFIALGSGEPYSRIYYELDMGPNDAFFGASVYNPNGVCSGIQDTLLACNDTG